MDRVSCCARNLNLTPLLSAEARLRAKADAGRGRRTRIGASRRPSTSSALGEGDSPRTHCLRNLRMQPLTPTLSPQERGEGAH